MDLRYAKNVDYCLYADNDSITEYKMVYLMMMIIIILMMVVKKKKK